MLNGIESGVAVCVLAGGEASRFPGKLDRPLHGIPLLRLTYENVRDIGPVFVSVKEPSQATALHGTAVRIVADAHARRGPLEGLISAFSVIDAPWIFVVAGDTPYAGRQLYDALLKARQPGCEAVVPLDADGTLQPLTALYERTAFLRAGRQKHVRESGAVRGAVEELRAVRVRVANERAFFNINTEADYRTAGEETP